MSRSILDLNSLMRDVVDDAIMRQVMAQEEQLEKLAISGCFIEDMWIVFRPYPGQRWSVMVGEPPWRLTYSEAA